jgi:hypothetical protein
VKEFSIFLCLNSSKIQVCVFPKEKLISIREKSKHTSKERFESKEIHTHKKKENTYRRCIRKPHATNPLGN